MPTMYNHTGAGFPDVCANGLQFWTIIGGIPDEVGGTSAATPTVAGIVSLLNDARLAQNKSSLGLVNPLFYAHPEAFTDIIGGQNSGGGGPPMMSQCRPQAARSSDAEGREAAPRWSCRDAAAAAL